MKWFKKKKAIVIIQEEPLCGCCEEDAGIDTLAMFHEAYPGKRAFYRGMETKLYKEFKNIL